MSDPFIVVLVSVSTFLIFGVLINSYSCWEKTKKHGDPFDWRQFFYGLIAGLFLAAFVAGYGIVI